MGKGNYKTTENTSKYPSSTICKATSIFLLIIFSLFLTGCGNTQKEQTIAFENYQITYKGKTNFSQQQPTTNTDNEIPTTEYVETGTTTEFKDNLIITESYNQGKGVVNFTKDALNTLEQQGLVLKNLNEQTVLITCTGQQHTARLASYTITSGFIAEVPKLYATHLFVEKDNASIIIWSHITEKTSEQKAIINTFHNIICKK